MTKTLIKRYPKKSSEEKKKEYELEYGKEAYVNRRPDIEIEIRRVNTNQEEINK